MEQCDRRRRRTITAIVQGGYDSANMLELREIERPAAADGEVLVRVRAASLHAGDYFAMRGAPFPIRMYVGFPKPKKDFVVGLDCAGVVESVGEDVTRFLPGDEVYGECRGSCAEYAVALEGKLAHKPLNLTFEQAAAVPTSAHVALQALRDHGKVQPGQKVLINGASGGVGTFAVQIAKVLGAEVTGVITDLGIELGRLIYWNRQPVADQALFVRANRDKLHIHATILGLFFAGGLVGALAFKRLGFVATLPIAALLMVMAAPPLARDLWAGRLLPGRRCP